ncbi:carboxypeptidase-like regulatory domain-containing protein [Maribacter sp. MMG018]|uniref:carboxypeptidase-like regulatory domain-containing protein n=1 Tax=Maribacter sp. MMG018 TaxID=2822688 RepID=UPI001B35FEC2|nr:carboxypeptidase-like regulatory domain-containing protein [Maribacter sp. MMG018]MBQ4913142.1 carboxypeptidase-like regulatory domain-containing protein [Maribacter sp. MMG018]
MHRKILFILVFLCFKVVFGQDIVSVSGVVINTIDRTPISGASIAIEGENLETKTDDSGYFILNVNLKNEFILRVSFQDYTIKRIPIIVADMSLQLGEIYLQPDISIEKQDNLITLTEAELLDDGANANSLGLLQSTRDIFLNRAAFDFGQAFFRVRGYDAQNGEVLINGILMNKILDGRPQWNNWGGLNDVVRNQQFTNGLSSSNYTFGGILGNTNIDLRPSGLRPGFRVSSSASNRTYTGRIMGTYNSGVQKNGLVYMFSTSRRWAKEGYIDGTLYDAYSFYGALEYKIDKTNSFLLTGILASNRRGRSSALTQEVFNLIGNRYNPYWGKQEGKIRNSRERAIAEPMLMLNYLHENERFNMGVGVVYQTGKYSKSRLGYYNAPNPDPTYYRYLPSFHINSPIGANFVSADVAKTSFLNDPQLDWQKIYTANTAIAQNGKAAYLLYDDVISDTQITGNITANWKFSEILKIDLGLMGRYLKSKNYAEIDDLLGADFHEDLDTFSNTENDLNGTINKAQGDIFNYNYEFSALQYKVFAQLNLNLNKWKGFIAGQYSSNSFQRNGLFKNERFPDISYGNGDKIRFADFGLKTGLTYKVTGRHWVTAHTGYIKRPPVLQNIFVNPRESNTVVPDLQSETISTVDLNYFLRMPKLTGRLTGFYTRFQNTTDVNFFFVDAGVGSDFVQEVLTDLDKLHMGIELGLEYQLSASVKLSAVTSIGKHLYASNPLVTINFDTASAEEDLIDVSGAKALGPAMIKDYKLAQGPQKAMAFGIEYRAPKYWWVGMTANYLANNYANISTITRTSSFLLDPETGERFLDATPENVADILKQERLDNFYLLNAIGGKSWLKKGKYIGVFVSVNNLFDTRFRTGGYEQSRNGNYGQLKQDNLSGSPSFAPKYWYGYGRTYFLNVAISF